MAAKIEAIQTITSNNLAARRTNTRHYDITSIRVTTSQKKAMDMSQNSYERIHIGYPPRGVLSTARQPPIRIDHQLTGGERLPVNC